MACTRTLRRLLPLQQRRALMVLAAEPMLTHFQVGERIGVCRSAVTRLIQRANTRLIESGLRPFGLLAA